MKVLIAGAPKTGTTALFYRIKNSLDGPVREMFEPRRYEAEPGDEGRHVMAKVLLDPIIELDMGSFASFEKKIGIVRDPRDRLISSMLYNVFDSGFYNDDAATGSLLELLKKKEHAPATASVLDIMRLFRSLEIKAQGEEVPPPDALDAQIAEGCRRWLESITSVFRGSAGHHIVRYEDFVNGDTAALEAYLGFPLRSGEKVGAKYQRVVRTKGAGDWRNWLVAEDVLFFRPIFAEYMAQFGYADDWEPAAQPAIPVANGSFYVRSLIAERRVKALPNDDPGTREALASAAGLLLAFRTDLGPKLAAAGVADGVLDGMLLQLHFASRRLGNAGQKGNIFDELARAKAQLEEERAKLQRTREERGRMQESLSWRLTKPLRWLQGRG
jgi:hypothetical protein